MLKTIGIPVAKPFTKLLIISVPIAKTCGAIACILAVISFINVASLLVMSLKACCACSLLPIHATPSNAIAILATPQAVATAGSLSNRTISFPAISKPGPKDAKAKPMATIVCAKAGLSAKSWVTLLRTSFISEATWVKNGIITLPISTDKSYNPPFNLLSWFVKESEVLSASPIALTDCFSASW